MITNIAPVISTTISSSSKWSLEQVCYVITIIGIMAATVEYIVNNKVEENKIKNNSKMSIVILLEYMFFAGLSYFMLSDESLLGNLKNVLHLENEWVVIIIKVIVITIIPILILVAYYYIIIQDKIKCYLLNSEETRDFSILLIAITLLIGVIMGAYNMTIWKILKSQLEAIVCITVINLLCVVCLRTGGQIITEASRITEIIGLTDDLPLSIQPYIINSVTKGKMIIGNVWMEECGFLYIRLLDRREIKVNSDYITFIEKCSIKNEIKALKEEMLVIANKVQNKVQLIDRLEVLKQMLAYANTEDVVKKDVKNKDIEIALGKFKNCFAQSFKCENEVDKKLKECAHYLDKIIECFKEEYKLPEYKKRSLK